jgi:SOS-response transcriptional repressor LexA
VNNEFTVKRLMKDGKGRVYLHPESTSELYTDIYPDECDEWESFGIVTYAIKKISNR